MSCSEETIDISAFFSRGFLFSPIGERDFSA